MNKTTTRLTTLARVTPHRAPCEPLCADCYAAANPSSVLWRHAKPGSWAIHDAACNRLNEWMVADEVLRLSGTGPGVEHRFEGIVCRAIRRVLFSKLSLDDQAWLLEEIDDEQAHAESRVGYRISQRAIHAFQVRAGRMLAREGVA